MRANREKVVMCEWVQHPQHPQHPQQGDYLPFNAAIDSLLDILKNRTFLYGYGYDVEIVYGVRWGFEKGRFDKS